MQCILEAHKIIATHFRILDRRTFSFIVKALVTLLVCNICFELFFPDSERGASWCLEDRKGKLGFYFLLPASSGVLYFSYQAYSKAASDAGHSRAPSPFLGPLLCS